MKTKGGKPEDFSFCILTRSRDNRDYSLGYLLEMVQSNNLTVRFYKSYPHSTFWLLLSMSRPRITRLILPNTED